MIKNLVIILCKQSSSKIQTFKLLLDKHNIPYLEVCDSYSLEQDQYLLDIGFYNLTRSPYIKKPSAWDKAFFVINNQELINLYEYFTFIEDDVYSKEYISLIEFIIKMNHYYSDDLITKYIRPKSHYPTWQHWKEEYTKEFKFPSQSFNPICRLSSRMISKILEYRQNQNKFNFHEIIIPSLCLDNFLSYKNYIDEPILNEYIGKIQYNPILTEELILDNLIYHPVKNSANDREKSLVSLDSCR